ncbi:MAG: response regulator [Planctomycetota bacterium]
MIMQRPQPEMPVVLIIEHRDAVYQRLAEDLYHAGFHVKRACYATEGIVQHFMFAPDLVVANVDLPDQSGWLLTAKLRITEPRPHVWLYKSRASGSDMAKARFLGAEELLTYNSLQQLSDAVFASLSGDTSSRRAVVGHGRICLDAVG